MKLIFICNNGYLEKEVKYYDIGSTGIKKIL
ncbi:hypothetical protein CLOSAC_28840 [Clostridium saccharobutylicum]|uniref:Uncharacterized protein n=1 Tax=Clostridium saccharobutylicum TaxID=169679 RepID=A0A1S8N488_CLOSA|nr:hypothetical protein CLOSAC_28840 [Clostridium saccharobutylicum]